QYFSTPVYPQPQPPSELDGIYQNFNKPLDALAESTTSHDGEDAGDDLIAYSILMLSGESAAVSEFVSDHLEGKGDEHHHVATWFHPAPLPEGIRQLADDAGLTTEFPTLVCKIGSNCTFLNGGEVPLTRGWKVDSGGVARPIVEFQSFGLSIEITPRTTDDGHLISNLVIEERQLSGTEQSNVQTPDGGEFTIDVPKFGAVRRIDTGHKTQPGQSMVIQYSIPEENRTTVLVISARNLNADDHHASVESSFSADVDIEKLAVPARGNLAEPAARIAHELGDPKSLKPDLPKRR
ncbi:MAG: hypothetical protein ACR2NP_06110, partial [Pirellulaceae bacterium]